jgi:DNA-binding NarL/FixJ family response regulator
MSGPEPVRLLIADDHPVYRQGLAALMACDDHLEVVGQAVNGQDAIDQAAQLMPDVILMDISMPDVDGIDATRQITTVSPHIAVLMLTMLRDDDTVFAAMRAGAKGYLMKEADHDEVSRAVLAAADGQALFGAAVAERMLSFFTDANASRTATFPGLTGREREVLELLARGHNNARIAQELVVSPKTVRNHVYNIFSKLHVTDRAEAIIRARDAGLGRQRNPPQQP